MSSASTEASSVERPRAEAAIGKQTSPDSVMIGCCGNNEQEHLKISPEPKLNEMARFCMDVAMAECDSTDVALTSVFEVIENTRCVDCDETNPEWASLGFGTLVCLKCAGFHRSLGVHVTCVKGAKLDSWQDQKLHVSYMEQGGNVRFREHLESLGLSRCDNDDASCSRAATAVNDGASSSQNANAVRGEEAAASKPSVAAVAEEGTRGDSDQVEDEEAAATSPSSTSNVAEVSSPSSSSSTSSLSPPPSFLLLSRSTSFATNLKSKYSNPQVLYYTEILRATIEKREPREYVRGEWENTAVTVSPAHQVLKPRTWLPDASSPSCMICSKNFSLLARRHHCRLVAVILLSFLYFLFPIFPFCLAFFVFPLSFYSLSIFNPSSFSNCK
jgi:hypothetical protein